MQVFMGVQSFIQTLSLRYMCHVSIRSSCTYVLVEYNSWAENAKPVLNIYGKYLWKHNLSTVLVIIHWWTSENQKIEGHPSINIIGYWWRMDSICQMSGSDWLRWIMAQFFISFSRQNGKMLKLNQPYIFVIFAIRWYLIYNSKFLSKELLKIGLGTVYSKRLKVGMTKLHVKYDHQKSPNVTSCC